MNRFRWMLIKVEGLAKSFCECFGRFSTRISFERRQSMDLTLGERLRLAIGEDECSPRILVNSQELQDVLSDIIGALKANAATNRLNISLKDPCIISFLYDRLYHDKTLKRSDYVRATIACVIKYLEWCKDTLEKGQLERRWLLDFYVDFSQTNILPEMYKGWSGRTNTNNTLFQYADIRALLEGTWTPQPVVRDMLALFGLRQVLEAKFRRLLGLSWVDPMPKIPHETVPSIVKSHESELNVKTASALRVDSIMQIYNWTDYSIHTMTTNSVWLVWMAVDWCRYVFLPPKADDENTARYWHINGSIEIPQSCLEGMREDFRKWLVEKACSNSPGRSVRVLWQEPEAPVVDAYGNLVRIKKSEEIVSADASVCERRKPSVCFLIDKWLADDGGRCFFDNLGRLVERGVDVTVFMRECDIKSCPFIPSISIKSYLFNLRDKEDANMVMQVLDDRMVTSVYAWNAPRLVKLMSSILASSSRMRLRQIEITDASFLSVVKSDEELNQLAKKLLKFANADPELKRKLTDEVGSD